MSKRITDEKLNVEMSINGVNKTQAEISKISTSIRGLKNENEDLAAAKRKLLAEGKRQSDQYKDLTKRQQENRVAIDKYTAEQKKLQKQLGLTGMTMKQLSKHQQSLKSQMSQFVPNTPEWDKLNRELKETDRRLDSVRGEMRQTEGVMGRMKKSIGGFGSLFLGGAGIMAAWQGIKKLVGVNAELSDAQANVAKTTGLSTKQINMLTKSLKQIDTRSPVNELLALAEEAGRLGKESVEDVMAFVRTADMIKVALGDDLQGDINENVQLIGKLSTQYKVGEKYGVDFGKGMEKVGSAINEVAASGANQAGFLVDYLARLVGISGQTSITADQQLGFAAALDEAGQKVEVSGTTMSKVIVDMYKNSDEYAKIAKMSTEDFAELLETDANEALLLFLEGLNGNGEGLQQMTEKMEGLKLEGSRSVAVLTTLAANTDLVRQKQEVANKAIVEGTSLTQEFNVKNANLAGNLEKIGNSIGNYFKNSAFTGWLTKVTGGLVEMNKEVHAQSNMLREQQFEVNVLVNSITSLNEGNETRDRLLKQLEKTYPQHLDNLDAERVTNEELSEMLKEVNLQYREKIRLAAFGELIAENQNKAIKLQREEEEKIMGIEKMRDAANVARGKTWQETIQNIKNAADDGVIAKGLALGVEKYGNRIIQIRKELTQLEKEGIELQQKQSEIKVPGEEAVSAGPEEKVTSIPEPIIDEKAIEKAKKDAERLAKQYKDKEDQLIELIEQRRIDREISQMQGIDRELALIDERYRKEIEKAEGHSDRILELEALRDQEKNDLKIQRQKDYLRRADEIEEENRLLKEEAEMEREVAAAETQVEKDELRLQHARDLALQELEIRKETELAKVEAVEGSEELIAAIREKYRLQGEKLNREFDKQEKNLKKDQVKWTEMTEQQKADAATGSLALIADAFNQGSEAWKAAKMAETLIATTQAAQNAYTFMAAIGGPVAGAIGAAAAVAAGMKNVQAIQNTELQKIPKPTPKKVTGYEDGLYSDIMRTDGKRFHARNMGRTKTQIVNEPSYFSDDYLAGEAGPELIVDNTTFRKLDPNVVQHIMDVRHNVRGFETGKYPDAVPQGADPEMKALMSLMLQRFSEPIKTYTVYGYDDEEKRRQIQDEIENSKQNGNLLP